MGTDDDAVLEQLHRELTQALLRSGRAPGAPVTVAEIYQELVPYRTVRGELGFAMNADYEHALLRLLGGEDGRVRLEPDRAVETIRRELESNNPNVGIYRDFAACEVWIAPGAEARQQPVQVPPEPVHERRPSAHDWSGLERIGVGGSDSADYASELAQPRAAAQAAGAATAAAASAEPGPSPASAEPAEPPPSAARAEPVEPAEPRPSAGPAAAAGAGTDACVYCDSALPAGRPVRFCPYCGGDQATVPCGECSEVLEAGWMYCVACGSARSG